MIKYKKSEDTFECDCCGETTRFVISEEIGGTSGDETCTSCGYCRWWFSDDEPAESNYDEIIAKLKK